jgi:hypothetical protein
MATKEDQMNDIEVFVQGEGLGGIQMVRISPEARIEELLDEAHRLGLPRDETAVCTVLEDTDEEHAGGEHLREAGIGHRSRIHCHRCRRVAVTVNFNHQQLTHSFSAATTVERVKRWADDKFNLRGCDATEHALQLCGENTRPPEDIHLGTLITYPACSVCFDLVPKVRVEG